jgi:hypothetical protein
MMVEPELRALDIRNIREHVLLRDLDDAVLKILGVNEFPTIDNLQILEEGGAGEAVKIRSGK